MSFHSFDSFDDMAQWMADEEAAANELVTPEQRSIGYGDYFMRIWGQGELVIFGRVTPLEEFAAESRRLSADEEESASEVESLKERFERGYRFGRCYSVVEPDGELGDTHIANMIPITEAQFNLAKEIRWEVQF